MARLLPIAGCLAALTFGWSDAVARAETPQQIQFVAALSVDYASGKPLRGWKNTCRVIQSSLTEWQTGSTVTQLVVCNPTPDGLREFLQNLPGSSKTGTIQVIYLAARHTPAGDWKFTRAEDGTATWAKLLRNPPLTHPGRLVLLDVCHAGQVVESPAWHNGLAPAATLLASASEELTAEFDFTNCQPIDLPARYPTMTAWLRRKLDADWDGRLSNLGLAWALAFQQTPQAPHTVHDWQSFFERCENEGRNLQELLGSRHASTIRQIPPGGASQR